jgi:hypothetical protein
LNPEKQDNNRMHLTDNQLPNKKTDNNHIESFLNSYNAKALRQNRKQSVFDRSVSLDTPIESTHKNEKLDQFKKIIEATYIDHVLNKSDNLLSRFFQEKNSDLKISNRSAITDSARTTPNNSDEIATKIRTISENRQNDVDYITTPRKLQLLSAYNIYQPENFADVKEQQSDTSHSNKTDNFEFSLSERYETVSFRPTMNYDVAEQNCTRDESSDPDKFESRKNSYQNSNSDDYVHTQSSSSASSLSPPSANRIEKQHLQVKPPLTKPSANVPTYRKAIAKRQLSSNSESSYSTIDTKKLQFERNSSVFDEHAMIKTQSASAQFQISSDKHCKSHNEPNLTKKPPYKTNNIKSHADQDKKGMSKAHNLVAVIEPKPTGPTRYSTESIGSDTTTINHIQQSFDRKKAIDDATPAYSHNKRVYSSTTNEHNFDLKINLDELTSDDESQMDGDVADGEDLVEDTCMINISPSLQQVKPSFIPNLMLDFNEDDRSVSVAASLAKVI